MKKIKAYKNSSWEWDSGWLRQPVDGHSQQGLVIKVGGSLLTTSGWQHAIESLIANESASVQSIVIIPVSYTHLRAHET